MSDDSIVDGIRAWLAGVHLVPAGLERYAPLVTDGLMFFLEGLPAERLEAIVGDQLGLDEDARPEDRLVALARRSPTLHKLGQVIARDRGLTPELRLRLQQLETLPPTLSPGEIEAAIAPELERTAAFAGGPVAVAGLAFARTALAEGSVAAVVPFAWADAPPEMPPRGVFKVLKPAAAQALSEDLALWPALGDYLGERSAFYGLPLLDFRATLDGVAHLLRSEIALDGEQQRMRWAGEFYRDSPHVLVPQVFAPLCTPRLTAMERIDGQKITDSGLDGTTRQRLARALVEALLAKPLWSDPALQAVFHADPHAGNLLATADGRVAIIDWALTVRLSDEELGAVVQTLVSAATLDELGVRAAIAALGTVRDDSGLRGQVATAVANVRRGAFPGFDWLTALLDELARSATVVFPEATALFRKSLLTLRDVLRDVSAQLSVDEILVRDGSRQLFAESLLRALAPPHSRAFGTHVSNVDILAFTTAAAFAPARYLVGAYADLFGTGGKP